MIGERDLSIQPRVENIRDKRIPPVIVFSLEDAKRHFDENMEHIRQQYDVAQTLIDSGKIIDGENIWRSQIIFLDSAFDFYLHELTKYGLERIFDGDWEQTDKYRNLRVRMPYVERAIESPESSDWFTEYFNSEFALATMMSYDAVKDQLNLLGISIKSVADGAFYESGSDEKTKDKLERRINALYRRRNLIAHQADRQSHNAEREGITREMVDEFVNDIEKIVNAIHTAATEK